MSRLRKNVLSKRPIAFLTLFIFVTYVTSVTSCRPGLSYAMDEYSRPYTSSKSSQATADSGIGIGQTQTANTLSKKCLFNLSKELETKLPFLAQRTSDKDEIREEIQIFEEEEAIRRERERKAQAQIAKGGTLQTTGILVGLGFTAGGIAIASGAEGDEPGEDADFANQAGIVVLCALVGVLVGWPIYSLGSRMKTKGEELALSINPQDNSVKLVYQYRF